MIWSKDEGPGLVNENHKAGTPGSWHEMLSGKFCDGSPPFPCVSSGTSIGRPAVSASLDLEHSLSPSEVGLSGGRQAERALPTHTTEGARLCTSEYKCGMLPSVSIAAQSLVLSSCVHRSQPCPQGAQGLEVRDRC